jgi:AcrR family transcriptional regulator
MNNKALQEQRMRSCFTEAAKEIIKGEGMSAVSARTIAERAGYSYATLYNYFKDIKDLVFVCVRDFQEECSEAVRAQIPSGVSPVGEISAVVKGYMNWFMQYQGVFELFYMERVTGPSWKPDTIDLIHGFLPRLCDRAFARCRENNLLDEMRITGLSQDLNHAVTGMLLFFLARHRPAGYGEFMAMAEAQVQRVCRPYFA